MAVCTLAICSTRRCEQALRLRSPGRAVGITQWLLRSIRPCGAPAAPAVAGRLNPCSPVPARLSCLQAGLPDVPSLDELLTISSGMGIDLQPSSPAHVQPLHRPAWPPIRLHVAAAAAIPSAAAAAPAAVAAPKGGCTEHSLPAGWQPWPETPTSAEQVPCHITVMERPGASRMDRPSVRVYEVTRSSQRCCWQLSCEFSGAAAAAQCH